MISVNILNRTQAGNRRRRVCDVTVGAGYATGGVAFGPGDVGLSNLDAVIHSHSTRGGATSTDEVVYDPIAGKLLAFTRAGVELANASDQSGFVARVEVVGQ